MHGYWFVQWLQINQWQQRSCTAYGWKARQNGWGKWLYNAGIRQGSSDLQDLHFTRLEAFAVNQAIAADPDLSLLGQLAASQQPASPVAAGPRISWRYPANLSSENSSIKEQIYLALLQMPRRFCHSYRATLHAADKHGKCVSCLGAAHTETALTGMEFHHCGDMSLSSLCSRLAFFSESNPATFFLSGTCEEKAAGQRISAPGDEWAYAGCTPAYLTLSPQRDFSGSLHLPGPASLCGC